MTTSPSTRQVTSTTSSPESSPTRSARTSTRAPGRTGLMKRLVQPLMRRPVSTESTRWAAAEIHMPWTIGSPRPARRAAARLVWIGLWSPVTAAKARRSSGASTRGRRARTARGLAGVVERATGANRVDELGVAGATAHGEPLDQRGEVASARVDHDVDGHDATHVGVGHRRGGRGDRELGGRLRQAGGQVDRRGRGGRGRACPRRRGVRRRWSRRRPRRTPRATRARRGRPAPGQRHGSGRRHRRLRRGRPRDRDPTRRRPSRGRSRPTG